MEEEKTSFEQTLDDLNNSGEGDSFQGFIFQSIFEQENGLPEDWLDNF